MSSRQERYDWTAGRRAAALGMVVALAAFAGFMFWREFSGDVLEAVTPPRARDSTPIFDYADLRVPADQIIASGVPKDGIPALLDPQVIELDAAAYLRDDDRVVSVAIDGEVRGYPIRILIWHEVVNDVLGGVPIAVVYCPLCDSASVVERTLDETTYSFGVSGRLLNSNVLLYDRTDQALWSQLGFEAVSGPNAGRSLRHLPLAITPFAELRRAHAAATVLSTETGYDRTYGYLPYGAYFASDELLFPVVREDSRLPRRTPIVGVRLGGRTRAYPLDAVREMPDGRLRDTLTGQAIVLEATEGVGTVRVVEVPPEAQVAHTFWFAWAAFHEASEIYGGVISPASGPATR